MSAKSFENKIMQKSPKKECDTVETFRLISFDKIVDERGEITVLETANHLPFEVKRLFYVKNPIGERGNHAHKTLIELLIPMSGSLTVEVEDGHNKQSFNLYPSGTGLLIPPMVWARQYDFSHDCTYLVLASEKYDESDYIRDHCDYTKLASAR